MTTELPEMFSLLMKMFPDYATYESDVTETDTGADVATYFYDPHVEADTDGIEHEMVEAYGHKVLGCDDAHTAHDLVEIELHDIVPVEEHEYVYRAFATITKK